MINEDMNSIKVQVNMNKPTQSSSGPKFGVGLTLRLFYVVPSFMTLLFNEWPIIYEPTEKYIIPGKEKKQMTVPLLKVPRCHDENGEFIYFKFNYSSIECRGKKNGDYTPISKESVPFKTKLVLKRRKV